METPTRHAPMPPRRRAAAAAAWFLALSLPVRAGGEGPEPAEPFDPPLPDIETFMQIGYASNPSISAAGDAIYFTSGISGTDQVYRRLENGWPYQLTVFQDGVDMAVPSRDGRWVLIGASIGGNEQSQLYLMDGRTGALDALTDTPQFRHLRPLWGHDGRTIFYPSNEANGRDFHVYRREIPHGEPAPVLERPGFHSVTDVDPTGRYLLVTEFASNADSDILLVDLDSGEVENLTEHEGEVFHSGAEFSADGRSLYMVTNRNEEGLRRIGVMDLDSRKLEFPFRPASPWEVEGGAISPDKRFAGFIYNEEGYGRLVLVNLETGAELPSPPLDGIVSDVALTNGHEALFGFNSPNKAPDIWLWNWETRDLSQISHSTYAGVDPSRFVVPELIRYPTFDGREIPAFLYLPADHSGGAIPFIVEIHGGPESQFRPTFNRHFNYLLRHGFGILAPNIRGSSGYGREYMALDNYKKRMDAVRDVEAAARWLLDKEYTTADRLGIKGGSYGGYMTLAALAWHPDLFAAGCDDVGIADFVTFLENTAEYRRAIREEEYGPLSDREFLKEISPLTHVDRIKGSLLIIHGANDPRVPVGEARQIAKALSARGAVVDTLIFSDEGHGVAKRENRLVMYRRMVDFFGKALLGEEAGS